MERLIIMRSLDMDDALEDFNIFIKEHKDFVLL
jgi:hypothetical protein